MCYVVPLSKLHLCHFPTREMTREMTGNDRGNDTGNDTIANHQSGHPINQK